MNLKIIFLNFIWKTKIHKIIATSQWNKAFLQNKIIIYIIQILTSLKTALKNYTWKVCVLPQQNAFGRPFSLKKHEEMFCDFAKTSGFFGESRHTKCISLGEMHFWQFWRKTLNWTKWCSFYIEINFWPGPEWARFRSQRPECWFCQRKYTF